MPRIKVLILKLF